MALWAPGTDRIRVRHRHLVFKLGVCLRAHTHAHTQPSFIYTTHDGTARLFCVGGAAAPPLLLLIIVRRQRRRRRVLLRRLRLRPLRRQAQRAAAARCPAASERRSHASFSSFTSPPAAVTTTRPPRTYASSRASARSHALRYATTRGSGHCRIPLGRHSRHGTTHIWAERLSKVMKYLHREFYRLKTFFPLK
jgi:hypothetical protein